MRYVKYSQTVTSRGRSGQLIKILSLLQASSRAFCQALDGSQTCSATMAITSSAYCSIFFGPTP